MWLLARSPLTSAGRAPWMARITSRPRRSRCRHARRQRGPTQQRAAALAAAWRSAAALPQRRLVSRRVRLTQRPALSECRRWRGRFLSQGGRRRASLTAPLLMRGAGAPGAGSVVPSARRWARADPGSLIRLRASARSRPLPLSGPAIGTAPCQQGSASRAPAGLWVRRLREAPSLPGRLWRRLAP